MPDDILRRLERQFRENPPTIVLNKADAFEVAAKVLDVNAAHLTIVAALLKSLKPGLMSDSLLAEIKRLAVEPELQVAALKAAAGTIRDLATEERVIAARAARQAERSR